MNRNFGSNWRIDDQNRSGSVLQLSVRLSLSLTRAAAIERTFERHEKDERRRGEKNEISSSSLPIYRRSLLRERARHVRAMHESRVAPIVHAAPRFSLWEQHGGNRREIDSITSAVRKVGR